MDEVNLAAVDFLNSIISKLDWDVFVLLVNYIAHRTVQIIVDLDTYPFLKFIWTVRKISKHFGLTMCLIKISIR